MLNMVRLIGGWFGLANSNLPLAVRIKRGAFSLTMFAILVLGSVFLGLTIGRIPLTQTQANENAAHAIGEVLSGDLQDQIDDIQYLSRSALIWTALTDSVGRESYLQPFLAERRDTALGNPLKLLDYRGRHILGEVPLGKTPDRRERLIAAVLQDSQPRIMVSQAVTDDAPLLFVVFPVPFPHSVQAIGALAGTIDLSAVMARRLSIIDNGIGVRIIFDNRVLVAPQVFGEDRFFPVRYEIDLDAQPEGGRLALELYSTSNPWVEPIVEQLSLWLFHACLLGLVSWTLSGMFARTVTSRLKRLAESCASIQNGQLTSIVADQSTDEIGVLARSLRSSLNAYARINDNLEAVVEDKMRALSESEARFRRFFEESAVVMLLTDPASGKVIDANAAASRYYGYPLEALIGMEIGDIRMNVPHSQHSLEASPATGISFQHVTRHCLASGAVRDVEVYATHIQDQGRDLLVQIVLDVTERRRAEEQMKLSASVFSHAREGIMITSATGEIIDVNEAFSVITGYQRDEVIGQNPRFLNSGRQPAEYYAAMWRDLTSKGHWHGEIWNRRKSGEVFPELVTIGAVNDSAGKPVQFVAIFSDISAIKNHEKQLERVAHYDSLTTLPNRVLLADRLQQAMTLARRRKQSLAVVYLDLDGFKAVNDSYGHDAGDRVLMAIASRMKNAMRDGDTLARIGGDEFVAVLLDMQDRHACKPILDRLTAAAASPVEIGGRMATVSASVGVSFYPQVDDVVADQLLRQADQAMYQAKLAGRNRYHFFDVEHDRSVRGYHETLGRIHRAFDDGELLMYYQPKVNMRTGAIVGMEALARWQHPERGLLSPAMFLPLIEEDAAFSVKFGDWVIETALRQMAQWCAAGLNIAVSVNVGASQLQHPDFMERLRAQLARYPELPPNMLELEILETSALEDLESVSLIIRSCNEFGVGFSMDDFGTGYSSLTYLKSLPVSLLKIDQSFVRDMLDDPEDLAILEGVLGLANAFRRSALAEGVESVGHGRLLLQLGCDLGQGYGIARPMSAEAVPDWCASWKPDREWLNVAPIRRDDLPMLYAGIEHRVWLDDVEQFLTGRSAIRPALNEHDCRLGEWLDRSENRAGASRVTCDAIQATHREAHALAKDLCALFEQGQRLEAIRRLPELHLLKTALLEHLDRALSAVRS